jgi:PAS domain S-box-containing protein
VAAPDRDAVLAAGLAAIPELAGPGSRERAPDRRQGRRRRSAATPAAAGARAAGRAVGRRARRHRRRDAYRAGDVRWRARPRAGVAGLAAQLARRDADAWYRSLIDNAADAITVLERDGTIRFQTPSIEDILGHRPEALAGTNLADAIHPDDREWVEAQFARIRRRPGAADGSVVVRWRHCDGSYRAVESRVANLLGDPPCAASSSTRATSPTASRWRSSSRAARSTTG